MSGFPDISDYQPLKQAQIDWLKAQGVDPMAMAQPKPIMVDEEGRLVFEEPSDLVFWHPRTGAIDVWNGSAFALGEDAIWNGGSYFIDGQLHLFESPLEWLKAGRRGIFVIRWGLAFDRLRDVPSIAVPQGLVGRYRQFMKPPRMPKMQVVSEQKTEVAA